MTEAERTSHSRQDLVDELSQVRRRGIVRVESPAPAKELKLPILRECVLAVSGTEKSFVVGLEELIRTATDRLPEGLLKSVGVIIYGLDRDFTDARPDEWRNDALKLYELKDLDDFRKRDEPQALTLIAAEIEVLVGSYVTSGRSSTRPSPVAPHFATPYINRPDRTVELVAATAVAAFTNLRIFIIGDSGTGKSRLILEWLKGSPDIWVDAASDEGLNAWLARFLDSVGVNLAGADSAILKHEFGRYLREQTNEETFIVIDGFPDPDRIDELVPADTPAFVIVTSRIQPSDATWPYIHLEGMNPNEAVEMVQALLPNSSDEPEARRLGQTLGGRPRLIEDACRFLSINPGISLGEFVEILASDPTAGLDVMSVGSVDTLTITYRKLVRRLAEENPDSLRLLELLAFASPYITKEYVGAYLLNKPYLTAADNALAVVKIAATLRPLTRNCIVREGPGMLFTPMLIQAILQEILADRLDSVVEAASRIRASREELYDEGWSVITMAGRLVCEGVLRARLKDRKIDGHKLRRRGDLGGARWERLIDRVWFRTVSLEWNFAHLVMHRPNGDSLLPENHESALLAARKAPQLLREDAVMTVAMGQFFVLDAAERGFDVSAPIETLLAAIPEEDRSVNKFFEQRIESPDGEIDLGVLLPYPLNEDYIVALVATSIVLQKLAKGVQSTPKGDAGK